MATIAAPRDRGYELTLLLLLTLANGVVAFDRLTVAFLAPYIVSDLGLSNAQVGLLAGALSGMVIRERTPSGCLANLVIGVVGGIAGGWIAQELFDLDQTVGFLGALAVAFLGALGIRFTLRAISD